MKQPLEGAGVQAENKTKKTQPKKQKKRRRFSKVTNQGRLFARGGNTGHALLKQT